MKKMTIDTKLWIEINKTLGFVKGTCEGLALKDLDEATHKSLIRCVDGIAWLLTEFDRRGL